MEFLNSILVKPFADMAGAPDFLLQVLWEGLVAGVLYALWLRYPGPDTTLSFNIMIDILLMVVIGGMGTMYGAVVGAALFVLAQSYLQVLMAAGSAALAGLPILPNLIHPDRWLLWLGALFVISVYAFPGGIVGRLRQAGQ